MKRATAYLQILSDEITDDLRNTIDSENLMIEVERTLKRQVLSGLVQSISELSTAIEYHRHNPAVEKQATQKVLRNMDYVNELFTKSNEVQAALPRAESTEEQTS